MTGTGSGRAWPSQLHVTVEHVDEERDDGERDQAHDERTQDRVVEALTELGGHVLVLVGACPEVEADPVGVGEQDEDDPRPDANVGLIRDVWRDGHVSRADA